MKVLANNLYLDSAFFYLERSDNNFVYYIQYYYLKNDRDGLINYVMSNHLNDSIYTKSDLALAFSRLGEVFFKEDLITQAHNYHKRAVDLMPFVIDYKIKYGAFLLNNNQIYDAEIQFTNALKLNPY